LQLENYVNPLPTYCADVRVTFDRLHWKLTQSRVLLSRETFTATTSTIPLQELLQFYFLFTVELRATTAYGRTDVQTDRQTDGWARPVMRPIIGRPHNKSLDVNKCDYVLILT